MARGAQLPRDLAQRRIPSELCSLLDRDSNSPFFKLIKRVSKADGADAGIIVDTALVTVIKQSINSPLGALALFKKADGESDLDGMYRTLCVYWSGVKAEFSDAWGKPPRSKTERREHVLAGADREAFEIDEQQVALGVVDDAVLDAELEQRLAQVHGLIHEDAFVHELGLCAHHRLEIHVGENVAIDVDTGGDFEQFQAVRGQAEGGTTNDLTRRMNEIRF